MNPRRWDPGRGFHCRSLLTGQARAESFPLEAALIQLGDDAACVFTDDVHETVFLVDFDFTHRGGWQSRVTLNAGDEIVWRHFVLLA